MKLPLRHYLTLIGIIALGAALRFWHLDFKPLWMDEVITALFSSGRNYYDVPLEKVFPLSALEQVFSLKPEVTCPHIAQIVSTQSVHPPLFFCLMHHWLSWIEPISQNLVWSLRALPALLGVGAIAALYCLNRVAFSPAAGLMGAAVMAVSPFAVYLSQEARHYTLPTLLITLSLLGVIQIQQDLLQRQHFRPVVWLGWMAINSLGFYIHYFFILVFIAQVVTLIGVVWQQRRILPRRDWAIIGLAITGVGLSYLPWLPILISHLSRPETDWLKRSTTSWLDSLTPLAQTLAGWLVMVIVLPVENQPLWVIIPAALLMVSFASWLVWSISRGLAQLWYTPETHIATLTLVSFTLCVLLEFFVIVYFLDKDLTVAPRYNFTYFPAIYALFGASLVSLPRQSLKVDHPSSYAKTLNTLLLSPLQMLKLSGRKYSASPRQIQVSVLLIGIVSSLFVSSDLAFRKPFYPEQVAKDMNLDPTLPLVVAVGHDTFQDVALGLSFALAIRQYYPVRAEHNPKAYFAFFQQNTSGMPERSPKYEQLWQNVAKIRQPLTYPLNLWVVAPELEQKDYPPNLFLPSASSLDQKKQAICSLDPTQHDRLGVSYRLYRCTSKSNS